MLITIDNRSGVPIYRQVMDQMRRHILTRRLASGSKIPSVREMASRLRVNPMTVSKAYALLEQEGLLERRRGIGLFVRGLTRRQRDKSSEALLQEQLKNAAISAIQLGVSRTKAIEMFKKAHAQFDEMEKRKL